MTISCGSDEKAGPESGVHGYIVRNQTKKSLNRRVQAKKNAMDRSISPWRAVSVVQKVRKQLVANELGSSPPLPRHVVSMVSRRIFVVVYVVSLLVFYRGLAGLSTPCFRLAVSNFNQYGPSWLPSR
jgi:hypothetical protein